MTIPMDAAAKLDTRLMNQRALTQTIAMLGPPAAPDTASIEGKVIGTSSVDSAFIRVSRCRRI